LRRRKECPNKDAADLTELQAAGQIVPSLGAGFQGKGGTYRLVVFDGTELVVNLPARGEYIAATADVNGDGVDEILIAGCGFGTGMLVCTADLVSVAGARLQTLREFTVYDDSCGAQGILPGTDIRAWATRYMPGKTLRFTTDEYVAVCPADGGQPQFRLSGAK
jgi:hypothetical protein